MADEELSEKTAPEDEAAQSSESLEDAGSRASDDQPSEAAESLPEALLETPAEEAVAATAEAIDQVLGGNEEEQEEIPDPMSNIERILDIELPVSISFGLARRPLSEVLKLGPGALLELDRSVDEPVVLKVNERVFARGEIVDVDGFYGVQITEIANTKERISSLGGTP
jgi:flagellar motor switch protein FliN